jgi:hypothetical protein
MSCALAGRDEQRRTASVITPPVRLKARALEQKTSEFEEGARPAGPASPFF